MANDSATLTIQIEGKQVGQRSALFGARAIALPPAGIAEDSDVRRLTLRDLIALVVRGEVEAYGARQQDRQIARALTADQITAGAARGKIDSGGVRDSEPAAVDTEDAVAAAVLAFSDGLYYVFIEDRQETDLDSEVVLRPDNRVTFLRLVALAGGQGTIDHAKCGNRERADEGVCAAGERCRCATFAADKTASDGADADGRLWTSRARRGRQTTGFER